MLIYISAGAVRGGYITAHRKHVSSRMLHRLQHLPCYEITCNCSFNLPFSAADLIYWSSRCRQSCAYQQHPSDSFHSSEPTPDRAWCGLTIPRKLPLHQLEDIPVEEEKRAAWQGFVHLQQVKPYLLRSQIGLQGFRGEQMQSYGLFQQESHRSLGLNPPGWFLRRWPAKPQPAVRHHRWARSLVAKERGTSCSEEGIFFRLWTRFVSTSCPPLYFFSILWKIGRQPQTQHAVPQPLIPTPQTQNPPLRFRHLLLCTAQPPISPACSSALLRVHLEPFALQSLDL